MSSVIFPDESKMSKAKMEDFKKTLLKLLSQEKYSNKDIDKIKKKVGEIEGYLIVADKKKLPEYFNYFTELNFLDIFNSLLGKNNPEIAFCILEATYFLSTNLKNEDLILYMYKTKFKTRVQGQDLNIIDKIISISEANKKDEFLTYQINFMKSLTLKINEDNLFYFYDKDINLFPILTKSFSLYNHSDPMVRNVVKNILLSIIKIKNDDLLNFLVSFPNNLYYTNLILNLKNYILQLSLIDLNEFNNDKIFQIFHKKHDELMDITIYLGDLLMLNIPQINFVLINCLLNEIILPLFKVIISRKRELANTSIALYIFTIILFNIKNKFISDVICYVLYEEDIQQNLLKFIYDYSFQFMNVDYMNKINFIIKNSYFADVNDQQWKDISNYMKFVNGIDLSTAEINNKNTYDHIKTIIKNRKNLIKNEVFNITKSVLFSNNEYNILIINLLIVTVIKYYNEENKDIEKQDNDLNYNPLLQPFFGNNISAIENPNNLFQLLIKLIKSDNNFRIVSNEVLLYNIQTLINIYIEKNKDKEGNENTDLKNKIINLLKEAFNEEIKRVKKLFEEDKNLWKSSYDSLNKAYDQYVKSIEKKMNDLITLPFVLVPVNITNFYEEVPQNLKANLIKEQSLKSCLLSLIIIHDIIYNIQKDTKNMIKSQRFPIAMSGARFGIGKEVPKSELGDEYAHCQLIDENDNNRNMKAEVIITPHVLYLAHIKGDDFDNFSEVKIFKKIPLRYLIIKVPSRIDNVLQLSDSSIEESNRKFIMVDCINSDNTARMFNYLVQMKKNCLILEYSLFNSFIDDLTRKVNNNETN
jgi:hypothetical protein